MKSSKAKPVDEKFENQDIDLFEVLNFIDKKNYNWYSTLTSEQKKKFFPYMMLQWSCSIKNDKLLAYYLMSNEYYANKHLFNENIQNHPELQWLMLCASSPGLGKQNRQWIPQLSEKYVTLKEEVKLKDVKDYLNKVYKNADKNIIDEYSNEFSKQQNLKYKIAKNNPELKFDDIEVLSKLLTEQEILTYYEDDN